MNRYFSMEEIWMVGEHTKRGSTSSAVREMQFQTTMGDHFIPTRLAKIKKKKKIGNSKCWQGCEETVTLIHCWWDFEMMKSVQERVGLFLKMFGSIGLPYDSAVPLFGKNCPRLKTYACTAAYVWMVIAALFLTTKVCKTTKHTSIE